jgi:cytochrome c556
MMRRLVGSVAAMIACLGVGGVAFVGAAPADGEAPSIKSVMQKLNGKSAKSESAKLKTALAKPSPDWKAIQGSTKEFASATESLTKAEPKKGSADSWKKFSEAYASQAKELDEAAEKKDLAATKSGFDKISKSCMGCHTAHRGR